MAIPNHISTSQDPTSARSRTDVAYAVEQDRLDAYHRVVTSLTNDFTKTLFERLEMIGVKPDDTPDALGAHLTQMILEEFAAQGLRPDPEQFA